MRDTIDMAREAGFTWEPINNIIGPLERFEVLVRADEREACAKVCDAFEVPSQIKGAHPDYLVGKEMAASQLAAAIRNRGNT
jgi:hypothetical protein